mgnify:CR=1 FL=1
MIDERIEFLGGYVDNILGPYEDLNALKGLSSSQRFEGLTVMVKSPIPMEVWLVGGKNNSNWRIKSLIPVDTYADLEAATQTIVGVINKMLNIGTEATVIADETNEGKLTKYWVTNIDTTAKTVTWEKMNNGGGGQDLNDYLKKDIISGEDMEK